MAETQNLYLSEIRRNPVFHYEGHRIGVLADVVVRPQLKDCGQVVGLVVTVGSIGVFIPATGLTALTPQRVELAYTTVDFGEYRRRSNEVLLVEDVLGRSFVDHAGGGSAIIYDVQLTQTLDGWACTGFDLRRPSWLRRSGRKRAIRDWRDFEPLTLEGEDLTSP